MSNQYFVSNTGECVRVSEVTETSLKFFLFESQMMAGIPDKFEGMKNALGLKEIQEPEYKRRIVAYRLFKDMEGDGDYDFKNYLQQYEELKESMDDAGVDHFFTQGGGFLKEDQVVSDE